MKTLKTLAKWTLLVTVTVVAVTFVAVVTVISPVCGLLLSANVLMVTAAVLS